MARFARHYLPRARLLLFLAEAVVVLLGARLGWALGDTGHAAAGAALMTAIVCVAAVPFAYYWADLYDLRVASGDLRRGRRLSIALGGLFALAAPLTLLAPPAARTGIPFALAAAAAGTILLRACKPWRMLRRRVLVLGNGETLKRLIGEVAATADDHIVGVVRWSAGDLVERARKLRAGVVVVAFEDRRGFPAGELLELRLAGLSVVEAASYVESTCRKVPVDLLRPASLIYDDDFQPPQAHSIVRRILSLAVALVLLAIALPILIATVLAIRLESRGPAFYRQTRVGRGGRVFRIWKFRTMRLDAEAETGAVWARTKDPRVTRVGGFLRRTRLDELPQVLNVLSGDMDLVGPRPERPEFVAKLARQIPYYDLRTLIRPGLTGWAQIRYPYGASVEDARQKLAFDLYYVKHASPLLDAIVLFHTAKVVVLGRGAR